MFRIRIILKEILIAIIVDVVAGYIIYLLLGEQIFNILRSFFPNFPQILIAPFIFATLGYFLYKLYTSVKYRRQLEKTISDLYNFLLNWDKLGSAFQNTMSTDSDDDRNAFEKIRAELLYNYPKITSITSTMRYEIVDRIIGVHIRNYDVIGNLLATSPFIGLQWFQKDIVSREFMENWDRGRAILVSLIGHLNIQRNKIRHRLLQIFRFVPRLPPERFKENENTRELSQ